MNYEFILKDIRPSKEEIETVSKTAHSILDFLNKTCREENIPAEAMFVGSFSKKTWLSGKSDIDIFIHFPLDADIDFLKEKGLYLGYKTSDYFNGTPSEHFASHPYLTSEIDGIEVDFVPCYLIKDASELKSAVDRTILHTRYIKSHLKDEQIDEVLLLKKFMDCVKTYGSEYKTGGFAGYLCELLILKYGTFEHALNEAQYWKYGTVIDLEDYNTANMFNDPLITIDPTDMNRNVAAALRTEKMVDFILASRNFMDIVKDDSLSPEEKESKIKKFFNPLEKAHFKERSEDEIKREILEAFNDRGTQTLVISFDVPDISADSLHPQLNKTVESLTEKINNEEFSVFKSDYWSDEENAAIFLLELNVFRQSKYKIHEGPKVWPKKACDNFKAKWEDAVYPKDEFLVLTKEREFKTAVDYIKHIFTLENIHTIKVGKNITENLCNYRLMEIDEFLNNLDSNLDIEEDSKSDLLNFLDDFLNPGQYIKR